MKKLTLLLLFIITIILLTGCSREQTGDPISDGALTSFNAIVNQNKDRKGYHDELKHWGLSLPDDDKFEWTKDTSANQIDFAMVMAAEPFLEAGLDITLLASDAYVFQEPTTEMGKPVPALLIHAYNVSDKRETSQGSEDALRRIFKQNPALVSYQEEENQYALGLSGGFEVKWTEEPGLNDADITFMIPAGPLLAADLDADQLTGGWVLKDTQLIKTYALQNTR